MRKHTLSRWRCRLVSWITLLYPVLLVGTVTSWVRVQLGDEGIMEFVAVASLILTLGLGGFVFVESLRLQCPVCFAKIFGGSGCARHKTSRRVLGSTRLGLAFAMVFSIKEARCRFCGTSFMLHLKYLPGPQRSEISELFSGELRKPRPPRHRVR